MTQSEFENGLKVLRIKHHQQVADVSRQQNEVKEEIANLGRNIHEMQVLKSKLEQQRQYLGMMRQEAETKYSLEVQKFREENWSETRKLEEVSDWALVNELISRGYHGELKNEQKDADWLAGIAAKFAGAYITPPSVAELIEQQHD